jgi:hypothetical protein
MFFNGRENRPDGHWFFQKLPDKSAHFVKAVELAVLRGNDQHAFFKETLGNARGAADNIKGR